MFGWSAPLFCGVTTDKAFFSSDSQAGRPCALLLAGKLPPAAVADACAAVDGAVVPPQADALLLVDSESPHAFAYSQEPYRNIKVVFCLAGFFQACDFRDERPGMLVLDRAMRIVGCYPDVSDPAPCVSGAMHLLGALPDEASRDIRHGAPVLTIPRVFEPAFCDALIAQFESSPHVEGGMASVDAVGQAVHKVDFEKKRRRDFVLRPEDARNGEVVRAISGICLPEMKKALQYEAKLLDRVLIARYDETGGYFRRHRDNIAPSVASRQFALSINLNDGYEGGHLLFPEYADHRFKPGKGDAVVFSASLLHEVAPVVKGSRYVLLSFFLSGQQVQAQAA